MELHLIERALRIAYEAHTGQTRKGDNSPYVIHPITVAMKLLKYQFRDSVIAAALVHDVLEDTPYGEERLRTELGDEVVDMVKLLSEDKSLVWEKRKDLYCETIRGASEEVKAISLADKIHNAESMLRAHARLGSSIWQKFSRGRDARVAFEEKMLAMFKESLSHPLVAEYEALVEQFRLVD